MASWMPLHLPKLLLSSKLVRSDKEPGIRNSTWYSCKFHVRDNFHISKDYLYSKFEIVCYSSSRWVSWRASASSTSFSDQSDSQSIYPVIEHSSHGMELNRVNHLVRVLHESARSFSLSAESLKLPGSGAELSNAWLGKDVHEWHIVVSYQVAIYALLKTAIEVEFLLSRERGNGHLPVQAILGKRVNFVKHYIESKLQERHSELVDWFRQVELPRLEASFAPLLKKWSMDYAGRFAIDCYALRALLIASFVSKSVAWLSQKNGVAGIIVTISCCAAVENLKHKRLSCPSVSLSVDGVLFELLEIAHGLVSVDKLYNLAAEAGCELHFLKYFGKKVIAYKNMEELEFCIGLAKQKLLSAFHEEPVISGIKVFQDEVKDDQQAILGLFAYLGKTTRLYMSKMGMKDEDGLLQDFLRHLECGILFLYPELSSITLCQQFMEIIDDEIGWLDFYASTSFMHNPERKRSKMHLVQAEKEIIISTIFTICYDVFSGFAHFCRSTMQPLDVELLAFLLTCQNLLAACMEDYWAAYDRSCMEGVKTVEARVTETISTVISGSPARLSPALEAQQTAALKAYEYLKNTSTMKPSGSRETDRMISSETVYAAMSNIHPEDLLRKYIVKFASMSSDLWMGTQLLLIDITIAMSLLLKRLKGHKVSKRERKKLRRTLKDLLALVPVTILMLLPVTAVGHAVILAAIKKYIPSMIPSPYSPQRLGTLKQLRRWKSGGGVTLKIP